MTVKEINEKFKKIDEKLSDIEDLLNDTSKGVDFYNACKAYYAAENGSIEQREAILDIFSIGFDFAEGKIPSWLGGCIVDQGRYLMDLVDELGENTFITEIIQHSSMDYAMDCYAPNADWNEMDKKYQQQLEYAKRYSEIREAIEKVQEINKFDKVFYDIGLINPTTGKIDLTVYNNWEDELKKYAEENNLYENWDDVLLAWGKERWENWKDGWEIIGGLFTKDVLKKSNTKIMNAKITRYDPLILDLDGDGYNVETKENGANFDLDKNGFAEKINWTKKDGFLCLDLNGNGDGVIDENVL